MRQARFETLNEWLDWQETLHITEIDLGLDRIKQVYQRLAPLPIANKVITVAGTNGKGSTVAILEGVYCSEGYRVGSFTSPHLFHYNERIKLNGQSVSDEQLCVAFSIIDQAREDISLTYFEFNALAAFYLFSQAQLDIAVLEVGLGGRLDACNLIDADVAIITSIGLDHQQWLGETKKEIAREKSGVLRAYKPAICAEKKSYQLIHENACKIGSILYTAGKDYQFEAAHDGWCFESDMGSYRNLPMPRLSGAHQLQNAAAVLMATQLLNSDLPVRQESIARGVSTVSLPGRFQVQNTQPKLILDVAHNVEAVEVLCDQLVKTEQAPLIIVFGVLNDKNLKSIIARLDAHAKAWYIAPLSSERSFSAQAVFEAIKQHNPEAEIVQFDDIEAAYRAALAQNSGEQDILVTGSFFSVSKVLALQ